MPIVREFPQQPLAGVGAVVLCQDQVLLVQRLHPPLAGYWSVPGGLIELGETAAAAAAREVREETGIEVEIGPVISVVDRIELAPGGAVRYHYVIADFLAWPRAGGTFPAASAASDAGQARWVAIHAIEALPLTPGLIPVVRLAQARRAETR